MEKGVIYQTEKGNVAFLGRDKNQEIKYCLERSTLSNSTWKGETKGSQKEFSFNIEGQSKRLYVYESPIDLLSHSTLEKGVEGHHQLSLGGLSDKALNQYLRDHREVTEVVFCFDNDKPGQEATQKLGKEMQQRGFDVYKAEPKNKDWNIDLIDKREKIKEQVKQRDLEIERRRERNMSQEYER